jgi:DNA-directed RNA polymerase subunit N
MSFPVRCFTCNKVIGGYEQKYETELANGSNPKQILDNLGILRYCCRRMFLGHVNLIDQLILYSDVKDKSHETKFKDLAR